MLPKMSPKGALLAFIFCLISLAGTDSSLGVVTPVEAWWFHWGKSNVVETKKAENTKKAAAEADDADDDTWTEDDDAAADDEDARSKTKGERTEAVAGGNKNKSLLHHRTTSTKIAVENSATGNKKIATVKKSTSGPAVVPAISPAIKCVINLTFQYFIVYLAYQALKSWNQLTGMGQTKTKLEKALEAGITTVSFCPMLAVLFLATRLRAQSLSTTPQTWAQAMMYVCTYATTVQTILAIVVPFTVKEETEDDSPGGANQPPQPPATTGTMSNRNSLPQQQDGGMFSMFSQPSAPAAPQPDPMPPPAPVQQQKSPKAWNLLAKLLSFIKLGVVIGIYLGFTVVMIGLLSIEAPVGNENCKSCVWTYTPEVPPALQCLISLTVQYFGLYLAIYVCETYNQLYRNSEKTFLLRILEDAKETVKFCPMLSVLFIGARMRATQIKTVPQPWAQMAFYICTYSVLGQTLMQLFLPFLRSGFALMITTIRYVLLTGLYLGTITVIYSVMVISAPAHLNITTPPVSIPMHCIMIILCQFFAVFFLRTVSQTYREVWRGAVDPANASNLEIMLRAAVPSLDLIPMFAVLFIAGRFRALEVDPKVGEVQSFTQTFMYLSSYSILAQTIVCMIIPYFAGELNFSKAMDAAAVAFRKSHVGVVLEQREKEWNAKMVKYLTYAKMLAMLAVYVGCVGVCTGILALG